MSGRLAWRRLIDGLRLPPAWLGYRGIRPVTVADYLSRRGRRGGTSVTVHPESSARHPLPCNISSPEDLPDTRGWWGYSFRDVPRRVGGETFIATLADCRVVWYRDAARANDFYPAIVTSDGCALTMRELRFRPRHARVLRRAPAPIRMARATWILERVYHNHSHWLTAHLPKLLLLRERDALADVLLPRDRTPAMDGSLRLLGLSPEAFPSFDPDRPLQVDQLTVVGSDRFRPELLRLVQRAFLDPAGAPPHRRVLISRAHASRRKLINEDELWARLAPFGFERVRMEERSFEEQVRLMRETALLVAPHGAGLTNMIFCPPGADVLEIADLGFPNPNFYALAAGLGHHYWIVPAASLGDGRPIDRDLRVDPAAVSDLLPRILSRQEGGCASR